MVNSNIMRHKKVSRWYCDFCNRGMFYEKRMKAHESGCTANVNRVCGMCRVSGMEQVPLSELKKALNGITKDNAEQKLAALRLAASGCPACMLTALRHHGSTSFTQFDEDKPFTVGTSFNFKAETADWWKEINDTKNQFLHFDQ